ncbi:MAG: hypothetical protein KTR25_05470 [Myxococcales bacterium]|nr:hypothetical protein [Myxococcales bacterium]
MGTRAVLLAMDAEPKARIGLLGFAIGKHNTRGSVVWLRGFKFFPSEDDDPEPGERRSTFQHPIQSFLWGDYSVYPARTYFYIVRAVYGQPGQLLHGPELTLSVQTASESESEQSVIFNRGAIPSQAFADRFGNVGPTDEEKNDPTNAKVQWLSRGLLESALAFIAQARGARFSLKVAAYELHYHPILNALRAVADHGATIHISYDGGDQLRNGTIRPSSTSLQNEEAISKAGLRDHLRIHLYPRTLYGSITHNKFIILTEKEHPVQVWTGSTNFTASGFLGQSNLAHIVRRTDIAIKYNNYWALLAKDLPTREMKRKIMASSPTPDTTWNEGIETIFSPRRSGMVNWYAERLHKAKRSVMFTAAFGVSAELAHVFAEDRDILRFVLMERKDRNLNEQALLESDKDTVIALGTSLNRLALHHRLPGYKLDEWFHQEEHYRTKGHIFYIHTKYMLVDILSDHPYIFSGSANFSNNSVERNDENMLLLSGASATSVMGVYVTEFQRLFNHFYFRTIALRRARSSHVQRETKIATLDPTDRWVHRHFRPGSYHDKRRRLFQAPSRPSEK